MLDHWLIQWPQHTHTQTDCEKTWFLLHRWSKINTEESHYHLERNWYENHQPTVLNWKVYNDKCLKWRLICNKENHHHIDGSECNWWFLHSTYQFIYIVGCTGYGISYANKLWYEALYYAASRSIMFNCFIGCNFPVRYVKHIHPDWAHIRWHLHQIYSISLYARIWAICSEKIII